MLHIETAEKLRALTSDFYRVQCDSFSATRQAPWNGWKRCFDEIRRLDEVVAVEDGIGKGPRDAGAPRGKRALSVFDLACGNLRFEAFLASALPETAVSVYAVDNCDSLVSDAALAEYAPDGGLGDTQDNQSEPLARPRVAYQNLDVLDVLAAGGIIGDCLQTPVCDLSVSFGFMHHVPLPDHRHSVLDALVDQTRSGGLAIVSLWQFMENERLAEKARATHERALLELGLPELDAGDFLLGWKNVPGAYRYCHSFSESEIDDLVSAARARATLVSRFKADGRTDDLNTYLVFEVK